MKAEESGKTAEELEAMKKHAIDIGTQIRGNEDLIRYHQQRIADIRKEQDRLHLELEAMSNKYWDDV